MVVSGVIKLTKSMSQNISDVTMCIISVVEDVDCMI